MPHTDHPPKLATGIRRRVALLPELYGRTLSPCASIRLHGYMEFLHRRQHIACRSLLLEEVQAYCPDDIIWHRTSVPTAGDVEALAAIARWCGSRLVYDIDDNLLDMDEHGEGHAYRNLQAAVNRSLQLADEVWCSTAKLAERVATKAQGTVSVLANALDPNVWRLSTSDRPARPTATDAFRVLYMGTRTHEEDFGFLRRVMECLHEREPGRFKLILVGVCPDSPDHAPWMEVLSPPQQIGPSYPAFVRWLQLQQPCDLGVAPLMAGRFNDCKSSIKILDYAALGLATLASDVPAYSGTSNEGKTCVVAANDVESWCTEMLALAGDEARLRAVAAGAAALVRPAVFEDAAWLRLARLNA